jgi:hypothetical protein
MGRQSWINPKLEVAPSAIDGKGLVARHRIERSELLTKQSDRFVIMSDEEFAEYASSAHSYDAMALGQGRHKVWLESRDLDLANFGNHSCEPNAELGAGGLIAMKIIEPGEEVTVDYAPLSAKTWSMRCNCGGLNCRGIVRGLR